MKISIGDKVYISKAAFDLIEDKVLRDHINTRMNEDGVTFNTTYTVYAINGLHKLSAGVYTPITEDYLTMYRFKLVGIVNSYYYPETIVRKVAKVEHKDNLVNIWTKTL